MCCGVPRTYYCSGMAKGAALQPLLTLLSLLMLLVVNTNTQEFPETSKIIMMMKENMEEMKENMKEMKDQIAKRQASQTVLTYIPGLGHEHFENISCPGDFVALNKTGECILFGNTSVSGNKARHMCALSGGHLFIPKDLGVLSRFLHSSGMRLWDNYVWIGADDKVFPNFWRWVDGTPVDALTLIYSGERFSHSRTASPGSRCAVISFGNSRVPQLEARKCYAGSDQTEFPYVCEVEPGSLTVCPDKFTQLESPSHICIYNSTVDVPYSEAQTFCASYGATLLEDRRIMLEHFQPNKSSDEEQRFWLEKYEDICQILIVKPEPEVVGSSFDILPFDPENVVYYDTFDYPNDVVHVDCSSSHRFVCSVEWGKWAPLGLSGPSK